MSKNWKNWVILMYHYLDFPHDAAATATQNGCGTHSSPQPQPQPQSHSVNTHIEPNATHLLRQKNRSRSRSRSRTVWTDLHCPDCSPPATCALLPAVYLLPRLMHRIYGSLHRAASYLHLRNIRRIWSLTFPLTEQSISLIILRLICKIWFLTFY